MEGKENGVRGSSPHWLCDYGQVAAPHTPGSRNLAHEVVPMCALGWSKRPPPSTWAGLDQVVAGTSILPIPRTQEFSELLVLESEGGSQP